MRFYDISFDFPSRSSYSRICGNLKNVLKIIRNRRTKSFSEIANIGYNATKKLYYYDFKISLSIDSKGFPIACEVISAPVHDVNMVHDLVE